MRLSAWLWMSIEPGATARTSDVQPPLGLPPGEVADGGDAVAP